MVRNFCVAALIFFQVMTPLFSMAQMKSTPLQAKASAVKIQAANNPNILFEGYSKILLNGLHVGYTVL